MGENLLISIATHRPFRKSLYFCMRLHARLAITMDPLYVSERASRERLWGHLVKNYGSNSNTTPKESSIEEIRRPLSIIQIERDDESNCSPLFELRYRYVTYCSFEGFPNRF